MTIHWCRYCIPVSHRVTHHDNKNLSRKAHSTGSGDIYRYRYSSTESSSDSSIFSFFDSIFNFKIADMQGADGKREREITSVNDFAHTHAALPTQN
jgi:hypothetical protein